MEASSIILIAISIIILLSIIVFALEIFIPIQIKLEMNNVIRPFLFTIEEEGILTEDDQLLLIESLERIGLNELQVTIDSGNHRFGEIIRFDVKGNYTFNHLVSLSKRYMEKINLDYERTIYVRKITN